MCDVIRLFYHVLPADAHVTEHILAEVTLAKLVSTRGGRASFHGLVEGGTS